MARQRTLTGICTLFVLATLAACGGGGGGSTPPAPGTYTIGGTATNLGAGKSVVLQNNGGNNLTVSSNGTFTFTASVADGGAYAVTVLTQPVGQTCTVANGSGTVSGANVTNVAVNCVNLNPDTGQTLCYNNTAAADCATVAADGGTHPRQDARFGRDAQFLAGTLVKTGAGAAGFDYTNVCMNGTLNCAGPASNAAAPAATDWACTKDNHTNLTWSLQTQSDTWANATNTLPTAANTATRCGLNSGWRLPTQRELLSLAHHGVHSPAIDSAAFPGTLNNSYWSSDTYAPFPTYARTVQFFAGLTATNSKTVGMPVRLVHGAPLPSGSFTVNVDGTVSDTATGLMWDRCSIGQSGAACATGTATPMTWAAALTAAVSANTANYKGYNDWRLPNYKELQSLVLMSAATAPLIDLTAFPATPATVYWSSTTYAATLNIAHGVIFYDSGTFDFQKTSSAAVRLVRSGQ